MWILPISGMPNYLSGPSISVIALRYYLKNTACVLCTGMGEQTAQQVQTGHFSTYRFLVHFKTFLISTKNENARKGFSHSQKNTWKVETKIFLFILASLVSKIRHETFNIFKNFIVSNKKIFVACTRQNFAYKWKRNFWSEDWIKFDKLKIDKLTDSLFHDHFKP